MMHLLRSAPCWLFKEKLDIFDNMIKNSAEVITNVSFDEKIWMQCSLPIRKGGLGLISTADIASSAFISSMNATADLQLQILPSNDELLDTAVEIWKLESAAEVPSDKSSIQKSWSIPVMEEESGLWLSALPSTSLGLCLDNDTLRISVALRIGAKISYPHDCIKCGKKVDSYGYHGLSCKSASGTRPRHYSLNETIRRGVVSAEILALLEPPGVVREDGKHPDGLTLIPWSKRKCLLWDATCRDTVAKSYVNTSSTQVGWVSKTAEGFESLGPWGPHPKNFVSDFEVTNEKRATLFLKHRLSIDIQRGNAASVFGTLPSTQALDGGFYLLSNKKQRK